VYCRGETLKGTLRIDLLPFFREGSQKKREVKENLPKTARGSCTQIFYLKGEGFGGTSKPRGLASNQGTEFEGLGLTYCS